MIAASHQTPAVAVQHLSDDLLRRSIASTRSVLDPSTGSVYSKAWAEAVAAEPALRGWVVRYAIAAIEECEYRFGEVPRGTDKTREVLWRMFDLGAPFSADKAPAPRGAKSWQDLLAQTYNERGAVFTRRPSPEWARNVKQAAPVAVAPVAKPAPAPVAKPAPAPAPQNVVSIVSATVRRLPVAYRRPMPITLRDGRSIDVAALVAEYATLRAFERSAPDDGPIRDGKLPSLDVGAEPVGMSARGTAWVHDHRIKIRVSSVNRPTEGQIRELVIHELAHLCRDTRSRNENGRKNAHGAAYQKVLMAAIHEAFPGLDTRGIANIRGCYPKDWELQKRIEAKLAAERTAPAMAAGVAR